MTLARSDRLGQAVQSARVPGVIGLWGLLLVVAHLGGGRLELVWAQWRYGFAAAAIWGLNALLVTYGKGPPRQFHRIPLIAAAFALLTTVAGSGSYWATMQLYPTYRVSVERAALFIALCTCVALSTALVTARLLQRASSRRVCLTWDWPRLRLATYVLFAVSATGTVVALTRIGYVPVLAGDPASARVDFPAIGGIWYRFSMLGGLVALLVAAQACARRASLLAYLTGVASLALVAAYGPRYFVALPLFASVLLWDRTRIPLHFGKFLAFLAVVLPLLAILGYLRQRDPSASLLGPVGLVMYGTLGEFRDLGWALDHYSLGDRYLHGATLGSLVVPILPAPVWQLVGIDKMAIYTKDSATLLAQEMGQSTGQRIGAFGEFFINYGWWGALAGAVLYGVLLGYLEDRYRRVTAAQVRALVLSLVIVTTMFAQVGQLNMFTSTLTGMGYPLALVALYSARRASESVPVRNPS